MHRQSASVLVIEDSPEDFNTLVWIASKISNEIKLYQAVTGKQAFAMLDGIGSNDKSFQSLPKLILLDLNLPGADGVDVLKQLKSNTALKHIPTVVMTTSSNSMAVQRCRQAGANDFITKPVDLFKFKDVIEKLFKTWLKL